MHLYSSHYSWTSAAEAKSEQVCAVLGSFVELNMLIKIQLCKRISEQLCLVHVF